MGKTGRLILVVLCVLVLMIAMAGCGSAGESGADTADSEFNYASSEIGFTDSPERYYSQAKDGAVGTAAPAPGGSGQVVENVKPEDRKVIKNADLVLEVADLVETTRHLEARVEALGGIVADTTLTLSERSPTTAHMTLRVPENHFESFLAEIEDLGTVQRRHVYTNEVTREYLDLEARIQNLKRSEERLLQILDQAKTVEEILQVEKELERVRGQIDSSTGELNYLKDRVNFSTFNLTLQTVPGGGTINPSGLSGVWQRGVQALVGTINGLFNFIGDVVVFLFGFLPVAVILLIVGYGCVLVRRKLKARRQPPAS